MFDANKQQHFFVVENAYIQFGVLSQTMTEMAIEFRKTGVTTTKKYIHFYGSKIN